MTSPTYTLTLDKTRVADHTEYLSLDGATVSYDRHDLELLAAGRGRAKVLLAEGKASAVQVSCLEVEFLGLGGLHELEIDEITVAASGRIVIRAEVRHGEGEGVEAFLTLAELESTVSL